MGYVCDNHRSRAASWICIDCDSLYCSECVEKRIVSLRSKEKTFYFCPKCNLEVERLPSLNPFRGLGERLNDLLHKTLRRPTKKANPVKQGGGNNLLSRIDELIRNGDLDDAQALIEGERGALPSDVRLCERYYHILKQKGDTEELLGHARTYLDLLARGNSRERMCEVYRECASTSQGFSAASSASFKIAGAMIEAGDPKGAADVYQGFIKNNPKDPMIPKASFLAANVFNERLLNPQRAAELLEDVIKDFPDHEMAAYARQYLGRIKR